MKVFCKNCRYIDWVAVDGPYQSEARCKKVKLVNVSHSPIDIVQTFLYCKPEEDNKNNNCEFYEERKSFLNKIFSWSW